MLNKELIFAGPLISDTIPKGWPLGRYAIECIKKRPSDEVFCVDGVTNESLTCGEILVQVLKLTHILREFGVQNNDVVAIVSENSMKYIIAVYAVYYSGASVMLLNPDYTAGELKRAFEVAQPKVVLCSKSVFKNIQLVKTGTDSIKRIVLMEMLPQTECSETYNADTLDVLLELTSVDVDGVQPAELDIKDHVLMIFLSSGTTGLPKCVALTDSNFITLLSYFGKSDYIRIGPGDTTIAVLPFFHIFGGSAIFNAAMNSLKLVVLPSFQPDVFLRCIPTQKVNLIYAVPPIVSFLAKHPLVQKFDVSSIQLLLCSGSCIGKDVQDEFTKTFPNVNICQIYGLTEACGACTVNTSMDLNRFSSIGLLIPNIEAMIWNDDLCENVGSNKSGEICVRGPSIMKGYLGYEDNNTDEYGFYHTGDRGYYDDDGYFYIVGRTKELIKYKSFQVAPAEIEGIIMEHPRVKDCAVLGIPDNRAGQLTVAIIVPDGGMDITENEIIKYVAERTSVQKHLHGGVKFTDNIPRNGTGKIWRFKLYDLYKTI